MLIIFGGLPGVGKTTVARELARQLGAVHIRIDSIEQALLDSGMVSSVINDTGYRAGHDLSIARDRNRIHRIRNHRSADAEVVRGDQPLKSRWCVPKRTNIAAG
jgi:2-phosphoglycerate kinase